MALMQLSAIPLGTGSPGVGEFVIEIHRQLEKEGIPCTLTDMGTIIEGEAGELLALAARLHERVFARGVLRVVTQISLDDRRDRQVALGDKIASVEQRLG
jgi:uncharacterized protein (TIGR00106 family)